MKKEGDLIILKDLEGNPRADLLTNSQEFLLPYSDLLQTFWTIVFFSVIIFLTTKFIFVPLIKKQ